MRDAIGRTDALQRLRGFVVSAPEFPLKATTDVPFRQEHIEAEHIIVAYVVAAVWTVSATARPVDSGLVSVAMRGANPTCRC